MGMGVPGGGGFPGRIENGGVVGPGQGGPFGNRVPPGRGGFGLAPGQGNGAPQFRPPDMGAPDPSGLNAGMGAPAPPILPQGGGGASGVDPRFGGQPNRLPPNMYRRPEQGAPPILPSGGMGSTAGGVGAPPVLPSGGTVGGTASGVGGAPSLGTSLTAAQGGGMGKSPSGGILGPQGPPQPSMPLSGVGGAPVNGAPATVGMSSASSARDQMMKRAGIPPAPAPKPRVAPKPNA